MRHAGGAARPRWSAGRIAAAIGIAVLSLTTLGVVHYKTSPKHFRVVEPGVLYRSGTLTERNLQKVVDSYGIQTVVNLRAFRLGPPGPWYGRQLQLLDERGVAHVDIPMDTEYPPGPEQLADWLALLDDPERHPILVHCEFGVVRTGMMVAVYEMEYQGVPGDEALASFDPFGHDFSEELERKLDDFITGYEPRTTQAANESPADDAFGSGSAGG